jgi:hypothetical protein
MKSKQILIMAFILIFSFTVVAYADEASKLKLVDEMFAILKLDSQLNIMFTQLKEMQRRLLLDKLKGDKELQFESEKMMTEVFDLLEKEFAQGPYLNNCKKLYAEVFTEKELEGIIQFYKSEAGQAVIKKMPEMLQKVLSMAEQLAKDLQPKIEKIIQEYRDRQKGNKKEGSA